MTRIIAGLAGSVRLRVPDAGTRPTSERVREAVFGALDARGACDDARVLDLYAGSGALGLEAASRGAASVVLVDSARGAVQVARRNAAAVAASGAALATVVQQQATPFVTQSGRTFDLVLVDPPYDLDAAALAALLQALPAVLADDGLVVLEGASRDGAPPLPEALELERTRTYGDTAVHWITRS